VPEGFELAVEGGDRGYYTVYICMNPEGVEYVQTSVAGSKKFIENGQLYIRVGETVYDITGKAIK